MNLRFVCAFTTVIAWYHSCLSFVISFAIHLFLSYVVICHCPLPPIGGCTGLRSYSLHSYAWKLGNTQDAPVPCSATPCAKHEVYCQGQWWAPSFQYLCWAQGLAPWHATLNTPLPAIAGYSLCVLLINSLGTLRRFDNHSCCRWNAWIVCYCHRSYVRI